MTSIVEFIFNVTPDAPDFDLSAFIQECDYHLTDPLISSHEIVDGNDKEIIVSATLHHSLDDAGLQSLAAELDYEFSCSETGKALATELIEVTAKSF